MTYKCVGLLVYDLPDVLVVLTCFNLLQNFKYPHEQGFQVSSNIEIAYGVAVKKQAQTKLKRTEGHMLEIWHVTLCVFHISSRSYLLLLMQGVSFHAN